jgi:Asp-tRNA(Asn)/Glu-tRNA(Gln) amidotransferase A subunit family amidase
MPNERTIAPTGSRATQARALQQRWEPVIRAFVSLDDSAWSRLDDATGPLAGVCVGVKDIVDAAGMPTRNGSRAFAGAAPAGVDAAIVAALRAAGAAVVGKTASTEFAFLDPTPARNPHAPAHTPGGSSSGSGAAVGAGVLDLAVATQTAGSLCRPAAYCGAVGFKPGFGRIPLDGATRLAPSFDTLGFITRDLSIARAAWRAMPWVGAVEPARADGEAASLAVGLALVDPGAPMTAPMLAARDAAAAALGALGHRIGQAGGDVDFSAIVADHRLVMLFEAAGQHAHLLDREEAPLGPQITAALREGLRVSDDQAGAAGHRLREARMRFWEAMSAFDVLVAPPVPATAPRIDGGTTGYQHMLTAWTVFGGPLLSLPWGVDAAGLPLAVMLAGRPGSDDRVLAVGAQLEHAAPPMPRLETPR